MANKKTKQEALNVEQRISSSEAFIDKNKKTLLYAAVAIIVIIAGFFLYKNYVIEPREAKANDLIFKGQEYFAADNYEMALNGDGQGYLGFLNIADEYSSTKAGNLANLYAGLSYAKLGKAQEAVNYLEKFDDCGDEIISPAAIEALANCYADLDQVDKATSLLLDAADRADNNSISPMCLMTAGQLFESQGKTEDALECYETIKEKYINSMQYAEIDKYIERVSK
ncbi:MAG: tetratricopeptide repeat protein [Paraprevotella sp.]|nr:tetratricopeptide repeat protein [Paraprevotella sp.]MBR2380842.1 tetratricopeptide repeat protein [Paraprevotella sp.]